MDNVLFIPPPPFFEGTRAEFDTTLEDCWYGRVVLLSRVRVKLDKKDRDGRSGRMDIYTAEIELQTAREAVTPTGITSIL